MATSLHTHRASTFIAVSLALVAGVSFCSPVRGHPDPHDHAETPATEHHHDSSGEDHLSALVQHVERQPQNLAALSKLAVRQLHHAREVGSHVAYENAERSFERWTVLNPNSVDAHVGLAYSLNGRHRFADALEAARTASHLDPDNPEVWALMGDLHFALGHAMEAEMLYQSFEQHRLSLESLSRTALMHQYRGRFEEAQTAFREAIQAGDLLDASPQAIAWCHTMHGELLVELGQYEEASERFQHAIQVSPRTAAHATWNLAKLDLARKEYQAVVDRMSRLVSEHPRPAFWITLGEAHEALGHPDESAAWYDRAYEIMKEEYEHGEVGHVRELAAFLIEHRPEESSFALELAKLDLDVRRDAEAYELAAWTAYHCDQLDEAKAYMLKSLQMSTSRGTALERAAVVLEAAGHPGLARRMQTLLRQRRADSPDAAPMVGSAFDPGTGDT